LFCERGVMVHTHASENPRECELVESDTGLRNIAFLQQQGLTGPHVALAHCIHLDDAEIEILSRTHTNVVHCPSSNLKLGSGLADVKRMLDAGIPVSLGADGAACNNRLDMFTEMRTAALLQKFLHGPEVLPARQVLAMATIGGARALGLDRELGSLEPDKAADVIVVRLDHLHSVPHGSDPASAIVYSAQSSDVETVLIDGQIVFDNGAFRTINETQVLRDAELQAGLLRIRSGVEAAAV
jgi:5-methylthioadenosine/S-adenosylhomocysteine deaminase